ncbi:MAG: TlyA family RNA methyltransferase [Desulfovibrionaceae bacterium]|nr:TlyA family RNA methyltransferase [Desulfovibrionaceae bacterium]
MNGKTLEEKQRADEALKLLGLTDSRERGKRLIMAGQVLARFPNAKGEELVGKPGQVLPGGTTLFLKEPERFVSRGAYKLLTAIEAFQLDVSGKVCLDAGASTGGFTDCLLQHGAARVYAVDVGTGQLDIRLRQDERVVSMENTNLRHAGKDLLPEPVDVLVADVSFISLTLILPPCMNFLRRGGLAVCLVKPQFELEPREVKGGVVRSEALQRKAVDKITAFCTETLGLRHIGTVPAKIKGPKGNQEYLAAFVLP